MSDFTNPEEHKLIFVTGNAGKFAEACLVMAPVKLIQKKLPIVEIQGTPEEIIRAKAERARDLIGDQVFVIEDVSLDLEALGGFPGSYVKDFLQCLSPAEMWNVVDKIGKYRATTTCHAALSIPGESLRFYAGSVRGTICAPRGELSHGEVNYNSIFVPEGESLTYGQMTMHKHADVSHRGISFRQIRKDLYQLRKP